VQSEEAREGSEADQSGAEELSCF